MTVADIFAQRTEAMIASEAFEARGDYERVSGMISTLASHLGVLVAIACQGDKARAEGLARTIHDLIDDTADAHLASVQIMEARWDRWMPNRDRR